MRISQEARNAHVATYGTICGGKRKSHQTDDSLSSHVTEQSALHILLAPGAPQFGAARRIKAYKTGTRGRDADAVSAMHIAKYTTRDYIPRDLFARQNGRCPENLLSFTWSPLVPNCIAR